MAMIERLIGCSGQNLLINDTNTNEWAQFDTMRPSRLHTIPPTQNRSSVRVRFK